MKTTLTRDEIHEHKHILDELELWESIGDLKYEHGGARLTINSRTANKSITVDVHTEWTRRRINEQNGDATIKQKISLIMERHASVALEEIKKMICSQLPLEE